MNDKKQIRGDIISVLATAFPMGLTLKFLTETVNEAGWDTDETEIKAECAYLSQKGYVCEDRRGEKQFGTAKIMYTVTPQGVDLAEGTVSDPGVVING